MLRSLAIMTVAALTLPLAVGAQSTAREVGGDLFLSEPQPPVNAARDVFAVGFSTDLSGTVAEDAHAVGFSVEVDAETAGDLYATGGSVSVRGPVGSDMNAIGGTVRTHPSAVTSGNARVTGGSVQIEGPVEGALMASGAEVYLNAPIEGDAFLSGARIRFGPEATVSGMLTYSTSDPIEIPQSVAAPGRVVFQQMQFDDMMRRGGRDWDWPEGPDMEIGPGAAIGALAATLGSFLLVGALFLAFTPALVSRMRKRVAARPGNTALSGLIGLSMLFGSVPILAMTIIGIPLVPFAVLAILIVWFLGYVLGAYSIGMGVARALGAAEDPSIAIRLAVLAATALIAGLLNFIPIIGWMANFAIVLLGVGAMTFEAFERLLPNAKADDIS